MIYLAPAYGRTYKTREDMRKDWDNGKDFKVISGLDTGRYTSIRDSFELIGRYSIIVLCDPRAGYEVRLD